MNLSGSEPVGSMDAADRSPLNHTMGRYTGVGRRNGSGTRSDSRPERRRHVGGMTGEATPRPVRPAIDEGGRQCPHRR